jgi:hypothetical protein
MPIAIAASKEPMNTRMVMASSPYFL